MSKLIPLAYNSDEYGLVENLFRKGWKHREKSKPPVQAVFKIMCTEESLVRYQVYRASRGNEHFLFHGTRRACLLGEDGRHGQPCSSANCSICSIIQYSFDISRSGSTHHFQRFGAGIYTSACSSKADDYSSNADQPAGLRVLLVSRVVVGNALKRRKNATSLTGVPVPYHSLIGETGDDLNYEETVVYDNDAIRPAYLIVYGNAPGASKSRSWISRLLKTPLA